jgi:hypothetical protein
MPTKLIKFKRLQAGLLLPPDKEWVPMKGRLGAYAELAATVHFAYGQTER